jgi:hypothetical protein
MLAMFEFLRAKSDPNEMTRCARGSHRAPDTDADQSGKPSLRRFSAIRSRVVPEKTIACLNFEIVRPG